jgi:hypothetical protein
MTDIGNYPDLFAGLVITVAWHQRLNFITTAQQ